jgi:hypothetical protein
MSRLRVLMKNILRRGAFEDQMTEEVQFHIDSRAADLIRSGMRPHEAARRARLEFGGSEAYKEQMREAGGLAWIDGIRIDLRYALRTLTKNPVFSCLAILSLALGIGANTAVFHLVNVVRLRALPVMNPAQLASVRVKDSHGGMGVNGFPADMTYPLFEHVRDHQQALDGVFAWGHGSATIGDGTNLRPVRLLWMSGETFKTLGITPERGRLLTPDDDRRMRTGNCRPQPLVVAESIWWTRRHHRQNGDDLHCSRLMSSAEERSRRDRVDALPRTRHPRRPRRDPRERARSGASAEPPLVAWGLVIGVPAALLLARWMTSLVFGVGPRDVRTIVTTVVALAVVAIGAALIPARRAASVDPIVALRVE